MTTYEDFQPGELWLDTKGKPIQAHGGSILFDNGMYYWYGENKDGPNRISQIGIQRVDIIGISCYSSSDLYNWTFEGIVLPAVSDDPNHDLHPSKVAERPKVLKNDRTGKYIMWLHMDSEDYTLAKTGVAISDHPAGPFAYAGSKRPNDVDSRDMTLFKDDDGTAYLLHSSDWNKTLVISKLTDDYTDLNGEFTKVFIDQSREAPAVFKHEGRYYLLSSGCTGWYPNATLVAESHRMMGRWELKDNPLSGLHARKSFYAQSTYVFPVHGLENSFIFMADRWLPEELANSRYVWLPITFMDDGIEVKWTDRWDLNTFRK
jgi:hypothetical protein